MIETELAWAAGFLDGEGCFTLVKHSKSTHPSQRAIHISASQTSIEPLLILQRLFGGTVRQHSRATAKGTVIYIWLLGQDARVVRGFIPQVLPYLVVKRPQAEILFEFADTIRRRGRPKTGIIDFTSRDEIMTRERLISEMESTRGGSVAKGVVGA